MRIEPISTLEEARAPWEELEERSGNVFATWAWADAWWGVYGRGRRLALHVVRHDDGRLAALLPLYRADRGPLPRLRFLGHGAADELRPVCGPADASLAAAALEDVVPVHGMLVVERVRGDDPVLRTLHGTVVRSEASPVLVRAGRDWDGWLAERSGGFRKDLRRQERRLCQGRDVRFRLAGDPERLDADLAELIDLHHAHFPPGVSTAFAPARAAFHRRFARRALRRGWLRLWMLEVDGRTVAANYGFRFAGSEWLYQGGRDPAWNGLGVGQALNVHSVRDAFAAGVETVRFGLGDEAYKARFTNADPGLRTVVVGSGPARVAAGAAAKAVRRLPTAVRRPLARRVA